MIDKIKIHIEEAKAFNADNKEKLEETYQQRKQSALPDYPIFMAIAEDIGYDATGKATGTNELDVIGAELARFIGDEVNYEPT